jgi:PAS domain S-box-containing protein
MTEPVRILHLEDDAADAELVRSLLETELDCAVTHARCREEFVAGLAREPYDMIISDFSLPGFDGFSALLLAREKLPEVPRLLVSGAIGEDAAVEALKTGVADCVIKENLKRLVPAVRRALEEAAGARERQRLDEALQASQQSLRQYAEEIIDLYSNSPVGYHSLDGRGLIRRINDTALAWLGYSRQEVVGKRPFWDLFATQSRTAFQAGFPDFKATGWMPPQEHELVRKDGSIMPVLLSATAIKDAAGDFLMSRSTIVDLTEQKRAREEKAKRG